MQKADIPDPLLYLQSLLEGKKDIPMTLATVDRYYRPNARTVLLKHLDVKNGAIHFFTNLESQKAQEIDRDKNVCVVILIDESQIRIHGKADPLPKDISLAYFKTRSKGSQKSAHVSKQSKVVSSREEMERIYEEADPENTNELPAHWGGFAISIQEIEFWQQREDRFHDRIAFSRSGKWGRVSERLVDAEGRDWHKVRLWP